MKRILLAAAAASVLSGCFQTESGPRSFDISTATATPANAAPEVTEKLLSNTSNSYVTMVVYEATLRELQSADDKDPEAVTSGSGFVLDNNGHILTAGHVGVSKGWYVNVTGPKGRVFRGNVLSIRHDTDMALIKITDPVGLTPVVPVANPCLPVGGGIFSLGKPRQRTHTARFGTVAAMSFGRPVKYRSFGYNDAMVLRLQTRKGESGGPVFDNGGKLAGMVVSTLSDGTGRHLDLAHAVTSPMIADFVCSKTKCSSAWRALRGRSTSSCPKGPKTASNKKRKAS